MRNLARLTNAARRQEITGWLSIASYSHRKDARAITDTFKRLQWHGDWDIDKRGDRYCVVVPPKYYRQACFLVWGVDGRDDDA